MLARRLLASLIFLFFLAGCRSADKNPPVITAITTSAKFLAKSDCMNTSLTVTATITDDTGVKAADLWYRVGADQPFTSTPMQSTGQDVFAATVVALDIPGGEYGPVEFYILAGDEAGNQSRSPLDDTVQLLPCVSN